ncbi:Carbonic anhydrase 2 [Phytophthora cinnamomi]|uniref:Carbonic anhydrase 2 n=1 Tax=Phytophthora cinnamomi TaxID=4785 RepID=UPI00355A3E0A|nr:Carbonic anhydrase 2 [Phytophthora cinnamomi]
MKVTPEVMAQLESYISDNCTFTLETMRTMLSIDMNMQLSTSTISRHLRGMTYTVKQVRIEPMTCNNLANRTKRQIFAKALKKHQQDGDFVVYFDETNYNVFCKRGRGRAKKDTRATLMLPPSKGANLQVQCAVNSDTGVLLYKLERGSVRMEQNAAFIDATYATIKASPVFNENYGGKKIVVVLDNAPAHRQTEERVTPHDDLVLLRLAPYSPMCNPIEGCFSVLKAHTWLWIAKQFSTAQTCMKYITPTVVTKMELHARDSVNAAEAMADMIYGA